MLTIFSMFLQSLQNAFEQSSISKVAYAIVYMVLIILALNSFHVAIEYTKETIDMMISFLLALIPLLLALIAASGGLISAAFFHPVFFFNEYKRDLNPVCRLAVIIFRSHFKYCKHDD